jgi:hypothetical protein
VYKSIGRFCVRGMVMVMMGWALGESSTVLVVNRIKMVDCIVLSLLEYVLKRTMEAISGCCRSELRALRKVSQMHIP